MSFQIMNEFKKFAMRGNVVDMAVGVVIGGAFGKIVNSLVNDVLMPPLSFLIGRVNFGNLSLTLKQATATSQAVVIKYGALLSDAINFFIIAFTMFMVVTSFNRLAHRHEIPPEPTEKKCPECQMLVPITARRCGHCSVVIA